MTKYRIKAIDNNIFIAQRKSGFFSPWESIDKYNFLFLWTYNLAYCECLTFEEAENIIFKNKELTKKKKIKYFNYDKI